MRILDQESDKKLDNIIIFFTKEEAIQLKSYLNQLLDKPELHHSHLSSADYQKEITVCVYREDNISSFDDRSKKLILHDE